MVCSPDRLRIDTFEGDFDGLNQSLFIKSHSVNSRHTMIAIGLIARPMITRARFDWG